MLFTSQRDLIKGLFSGQNYPFTKGNFSVVTCCMENSPFQLGTNIADVSFKRWI